MNPINACALATVFLVFSVLLNATQPIRVHIDRQQGFEPLNVKVEVYVPYHADNVEACLSLAGPKEYPLACWPADPGSSPVHTTTWRELPAGGYRAQAALRRGKDWIHSNVVLLHVAGEGE